MIIKIPKRHIIRWFHRKTKTKTKQQKKNPVEKHQLKKKLSALLYFHLSGVRRARQWGRDGQGGKSGEKRR